MTLLHQIAEQVVCCVMQVSCFISEVSNSTPEHTYQDIQALVLAMC